MEVIKKTWALAFLFLPLLLSLTTCTVAEFRSHGKVSNAASWCIVKPSTDEDQLHRNINYCCQQTAVDCGVIQPGGHCFRPESAVSHASVAMNLYYQTAGKQPHACSFNTSGLIIYQDPSVGDCIYVQG